MPVERDSEVYNMRHARRGTAIIFNHMNFDGHLGLKVRNGTNADRDRLRTTLRALDFDVKVYNDLKFKVSQAMTLSDLFIVLAFCYLTI